MVTKDIIKSLAFHKIVPEACPSGVHGTSYAEYALQDNDLFFHSAIGSGQYLIIDFKKEVLVKSYSIRQKEEKCYLSNWNLEVSKNNELTRKEMKSLKQLCVMKCTHHLFQQQVDFLRSAVREQATTL